MKLNEFVRNIKVWTSNEEQALLDKISEPRLINSFDDHEQVIIESLIRKSLVIKVQGKDAVYVYPNV